MAKQCKPRDDVKVHPFPHIREVPLGGEDGQVLTNTELGYGWRDLPFKLGFLLIDSVEKLPNPGQEGILYLVDTKEETEEGRLYDEYIWNTKTNKYDFRARVPLNLKLLWDSIQGKPFKGIGKGLTVKDDKLEIAFEELQ